METWASLVAQTTLQAPLSNFSMSLLNCKVQKWTLHSSIPSSARFTSWFLDIILLSYPNNTQSFSKIIHLYQLENKNNKHKDNDTAICCCPVAKSRLTLCDPMDCRRQASLSFTISRSRLKLMFIESVMPSSHLILCHLFLLLPSILPSIRIFSNESSLHIRWPKYWSFSFSPANEYSGLISFRIDWFDLRAVQGTLKNLLQHHSLKTAALRCSALWNMFNILFKDACNTAPLLWLKLQNLDVYGQVWKATWR